LSSKRAARVIPERAESLPPLPPVLIVRESKGNDMPDGEKPKLLIHPVVHVHRCAHCHDPRDADKKYCNRCQAWADKYTEILSLVRKIKR
jgi:hypothetical protein